MNPGGGALPSQQHASHDHVLQSALGGLCLACAAAEAWQALPGAETRLHDLTAFATRSPALLASVWSHAPATIEAVVSAAAHHAVRLSGGMRTRLAQAAAERKCLAWCSALVKHRLKLAHQRCVSDGAVFVGTETLGLIVVLVIAHTD